jgi:putative nucleotidyltransferase with HDIG domain
MAFAERLAGVHDGHGVLQLSQWAERTCERYGEFPTVALLLRNACSAARKVLGDAGVLSNSLESDLHVIDLAIASKLASCAPAEEEDAGLDSDGIDATIAAFLMSLDEADPLTAEHSRAVSLWARRLARRLSLPDQQCTHVARGGLLHDVGKKTTPREILLAPRALSDEEFATMRDHASAGAAMVREVERLWPFIPMVRSHHERLDGKGYPDRLSAEDISLDVRIVTVADCFNAMIGRRLYRAPLSPAVALDQLMKHRGTQFDPLVVDAMIDVVEHPDE